MNHEATTVELRQSVGKIRWLQIIGAGLAIVALSFVILTLITTVYAFQLAIETRGSPDQVAIGRFAAKLSHWLMPASRALLIFLAAVLIGRKTGRLAILHGVLLGICVGLLTLGTSLFFGGRISVRALVFAVLLACVGWLGGFIGAKHAMHD